jgi:hypothetical protein
MAYAWTEYYLSLCEDASNLSIKTAIVFTPNLYSNAVATGSEETLGLEGRIH